VLSVDVQWRCRGQQGCHQQRCARLVSHSVRGSHCFFTKLRFLAPTETSSPRTSLATLAKLHADGSCYVSPCSLAFAGARAVSRPSGALAVFALSCRPVDNSRHIIAIAAPPRQPPLVFTYRFWRITAVVGNLIPALLTQVWFAGRRHLSPRRLPQLLHCLPSWQPTPHLLW